LHRDDYRSTSILILGYLAATITGFLRQAVIAYSLGVGREADIYLIAFALPELVFIALPIILYPAFIPLFSESRYKFGELAAWRLVRQTSIGLVFLLFVITVVAGWGAPLFLKWLSPGFSSIESELAVLAMRLMLPSMSLMGLAILSSAVLQVYRQFALQALMTTVYNIVFAIALATLPLASLLDRASWAVTLGAGAALIFQAPMLLSYYFRFKSTNIHSSSFTEENSMCASQVARLAGPLAAGYLVHHLILLVDRSMATMAEPGSVAALNFASHLALVVGQVSGMAVSTVLFPRLAEQIGQGDVDRARSSLADALSLVWAIALPASLGLIILRAPVISVLFERGAFDQVATSSVSAPLVWYCLAVLADALCQPLWRVIYAQKRSWTVLGVNGFQTAIRLIGNVLLINIMGYTGLALSAALGLASQVLILGWLVYRRLGAFWNSDWQRSIRQIVYASVAAACTAILLKNYWNIQPIFQILSVGIVSGCIYLMMVKLLRLKGV
jgi:putative peptidoglycan lipid II flippase